MDPLITSMANNGVAVTIAAAFVYFVYHVITKTIPEQRTEYSAALKEQRVDFLANLERQRQECALERGEVAKQRDRSEARTTAVLDALSNEVRGLSVSIRNAPLVGEANPKKST